MGGKRGFCSLEDLLVLQATVLLLPLVLLQHAPSKRQGPREREPQPIVLDKRRRATLTTRECVPWRDREPPQALFEEEKLRGLPSPAPRPALR